MNANQNKNPNNNPLKGSKTMSALRTVCTVAILVLNISQMALASTGVTNIDDIKPSGATCDKVTTKEELRKCLWPQKEIVEIQLFKADEWGNQIDWNQSYSHTVQRGATEIIMEKINDGHYFLRMIARNKNYDIIFQGENVVSIKASNGPTTVTVELDLNESIPVNISFVPESGTFQEGEYYEYRVQKNGKNDMRFSELWQMVYKNGQLIGKILAHQPFLQTSDVTIGVTDEDGNQTNANYQIKLSDMAMGGDGSANLEPTAIPAGSLQIKVHLKGAEKDVRVKVKDINEGKITLTWENDLDHQVTIGSHSWDIGNTPGLRCDSTLQGTQWITAVDSKVLFDFAFDIPAKSNTETVCHNPDEEIQGFRIEDVKALNMDDGERIPVDFDKAKSDNTVVDQIMHVSLAADSQSGELIRSANGQVGKFYINNGSENDVLLDNLQISVQHNGEGESPNSWSLTRLNGDRYAGSSLQEPNQIGFYNLGQIVPGKSTIGIVFEADTTGLEPGDTLSISLDNLVWSDQDGSLQTINYGDDGIGEIGSAVNTY